MRDGQQVSVQDTDCSEGQNVAVLVGVRASLGQASHVSVLHSHPRLHSRASQALPLTLQQVTAAAVAYGSDRLSTAHTATPPARRSTRAPLGEPTSADPTAAQCLPHGQIKNADRATTFVRHR